MNYLTLPNFLKALMLCLFTMNIISINAQTAEFIFGPQVYNLQNQLEFPILVKSDVAGHLEINLRLISSTTDFDYDNSQIVDLNGTLISNANGISNDNHGPDFGFPCEYFFKTGNVSKTISTNEVNTFVPIATFKGQIIGNLPVQFCPTIIFEKSSNGVGYLPGSSGVEAIVSNLGLSQTMDEVVNHLNWTESNSSFTPFGAPDETCHETECETDNPNCPGIAAEFRIGEPVYFADFNLFRYPIEIKPDAAGFVESNIRLFTSTGFYDESNIILLNSNFQLIDDQILEVSNTDGGAGFGLPCELIYIAGNASTTVSQANTWEVIAYLQARPIDYDPLNFCPSIIFDYNTLCDSYRPGSDGLQAIISVNNGISEAISEIPNHLNWLETDPVNLPFGNQIEECGEYACENGDCEDLVTIDQRIRTRKSSLVISYNGEQIPMWRSADDECCISWQVQGLPPNPCPATGPFGPINHNPLNLSNGTPYTATVTCGECTVVFSGVAGEPLGDNRLSNLNKEAIQVYPNIVSQHFTVNNIQSTKSIQIINAVGEQVFNTNVPQGANFMNINVEDFEKGIYVLIFENYDSSIETEKIIKQ